MVRIKRVRINVPRKKAPVASAMRFVVPASVRPKVPAKLSGAGKDFFTDLFTRVVTQTKFMINKLLESPLAAIMIIIAVVVTISYELNKADNFLITFVRGLNEFKFFKPLAKEILNNPNRTMGAIYHAGVFFAVRDNQKVVVVLVGLVSLLMFKSAIENAMIAFAIFAFITVRDKELRFIAILCAAIYGYYLVATTSVSAPSG